MQIKDIISPDCVIISDDIGSKKKAIEVMSECFAQHSPTTCQPEEIFEALISRERLGSTGIGNGIAIPHARLASLEIPIACVQKLNKGIDFDASDGKEVQLIFGLLVPEDARDSHLQLLASVAETLSNQEHHQALLDASTPSRLHKLLQSYGG